MEKGPSWEANSFLAVKEILVLNTIYSNNCNLSYYLLLQVLWDYEFFLKCTRSQSI